MTTLSITSKRLPTWAPWATAAAALILSTLSLTLTGRLTPVRLGLTGAAAYALALTVISALIEGARRAKDRLATIAITRSEEHTSELQSRGHLVCRLLLEKKK